MFNSYPRCDRLRNLLHISAPNTVVMDVSNEKVAAGLIAVLRAEAPGVQIVAAHHYCDSAVLFSVMRLGITEFLYPPVSNGAEETFARIRARLSTNPAVIASTGQIYSFLPSRPGVGTTTTALNTALSVSHSGKGRVFLGDFDLTCGLIGFMLKIQNCFSIQDAAQRVLELDENVWSQITHSVGMLDAVHAGVPAVNARLGCQSIGQLAAFLRRNYKFAFADLSGHLEDHSIEIMKASKRIFVVTMPELTALHQAREKVRLLEDLGMAERATIILNRTPRHSAFQTKEVEKLVGATVQMTFREDPASVQRALTAGTGVARNSQIGAQYDAFAGSLMGPEAAPKKKRSFVEYFYTGPVRYGLEQAS